MAEELELGRRAYERSDWAEALRALSAANERTELQPDDLECLGFSAYLTGHDEASVEYLSRAHYAWKTRDSPVRAARAAFWIGLQHMDRGEPAAGSGWLSRGERLLQAVPECAESGLFLLPAALGALGGGDPRSALELFEKASMIGERTGDPDLCALSLLGRGQALVALGQTNDGMQLLDDVMVGVVAEENSPLVVGLVYCAVIEACREVYDISRASEWTAALSSWCAAHPDMHPYRGRCLVHRAEVLRQYGAWDEAIAEIVRARRLLGPESHHPSLAAAHYELGEIHRLRGRFDEAEQAYREASRRGLDPRPGLARLRLAQGRAEDAWSSLADAATSPDIDQNVEILDAIVDVALACRRQDRARQAADELSELAATADVPYLYALSRFARGRVLLEDDAMGACAPLREAVLIWQLLQIPLLAARARAALGVARLRVGDRDTAELEFDAARRVFEALGANPDLDALAASSGSRPPRLLTDREIEVLALAARGRTNRDIAAELVISRHTVRRHLQNSFAKLGVSTRAEATAQAYERGLLG